MADEVQNLNIVITSMEETDAQIKIRDQNRKTYSFFKNKKDGSPTAAYQTFQQFNVGDAVEISYKDVPFKDGIIRNVLLFKQSTGAPEAAPSPALAGNRASRPGREYWEKREARRETNIFLQVAFKAAVELQAANVRAGNPFSRQDLYNDTIEFYDWIVSQVGEEQNKPQNEASEET